PRRTGRLSLRRDRGGGGGRDLDDRMAVDSRPGAAWRRAGLSRPGHAAGALCEPLFPRLTPSPGCGAGPRRTGGPNARAGSSSGRRRGGAGGVRRRLTRLPRRLLFRPHLALLLFGSLSLISGWLWFGTGLFLGNGSGLAVFGLSLPLPAYALAHWLGAPFDIRLIDLAVEVVAALAVLKLPWRWEWRYLLLAALFLDPFFYLAQGRNDVLFLAPVLLGVLAWERDRPLLASLAFGAAAAFKPFAVFFLPLVALLLWRRSRAERWSTPRRLSVLAGLVLPGMVTIVPFFLWNPTAYWADTVSFVSGGDPHRYPIQGYGFSEILLLLRIIPSPSAYFPFSILQVLAALPALAFGIRRVVARPALATALCWATASLALFLFFSRFVNDNYLAALLFLAVLAGATRRGARGSGQK